MANISESILSDKDNTDIDKWWAIAAQEINKYQSNSINMGPYGPFPYIGFLLVAFAPIFPTISGFKSDLFICAAFFDWFIIIWYFVLLIFFGVISIQHYFKSKSQKNDMMTLLQQSYKYS